MVGTPNTQGSLTSGPVTLKSILLAKTSVDQNPTTTLSTTVGADGHRYIRIDIDRNLHGFYIVIPMCTYGRYAMQVDVVL